MTDPKKPGAANLDDLKARLGLASGKPSGASPAPAGGIAPPTVGPNAVPPPGGIPAPGGLPAPGGVPAPGGAPAPDEKPAEEASSPPTAASSTDVPPAAASGVPAPAIGSGVPAPAIGSGVPAPAIGSGVPAPAIGSGVPAPAIGSGVPAPVAPPALGTAGSGGLAPPTFASTKPAEVAPPPFAEEEEEEQVVREVRVRKLVDDGVEVDEKEVGKVRLGPYITVIVVALFAGVFGEICGEQIDRAVRSNRAIESAFTINQAITSDEDGVKTQLSNLKSRISGAAGKALHKTDPGPDFELLDHLAKIKTERPFGGDVWGSQFYQAFKAAPTLFEYYRGVQGLWDLIGEVAERQNDPTNRAALKAWPDKRLEILKTQTADGSSGFALTFKKMDGKVHSVLGTFKNSKQERVERVDRWRADFTPLQGGEAKRLIEYQPGFDPLAEEPQEWFVRINPDIILGKTKQLVTFGGPLIAEAQDPYLQYLRDVNSLSKSLAAVQSTEEQLLMQLGEISQERRMFTFGF